MVKIFNRDELKNIISDYLKKLEGKISIDRAILFGSYAKGSASELSDIDLLVISRELSEDQPKGANGYYLDTLVGEFNPSLEVIAVHPNKLNNSITKDFFDEIISTGQEIYVNGISKQNVCCCDDEVDLNYLE